MKETVEKKEFLKIKIANNFGDEYQYVERLGVDSVAFVLYDKNRKDGKTIGLVNEWKPPIQKFLTTAFGGSLDDKTKNPIQICQQEVREEAGYKVHLNDIEYLGRYFVSTQMNQFCVIYMVRVSDKNKCDRDPQDIGESKATVEWFSPEKIIQGNDWKAIVAIQRIIYLVNSGRFKP